MLYRHPDRERRLWDTTLYHHRERYHLFFIAGDGRLGHATSSDRVCWQPQPDLALHGPSGSWHEPGVFSNNLIQGDDGAVYLFGGSKDEQGHFRIGVFRSEDPELQDWHALPVPPLPADGQHYLDGCSEFGVMHAAWRDPTVFRGQDGRFHMLLCARKPLWDHADTGAVFAHLSSADLLDWQLHPPLAGIGDRTQFSEVPGYLQLNGRHYLTFLDLPWGGTQIHTPSREQASGTFYLSADRFEGPYRWPRDPLLIGTGEHRMGTWASRVLQVDGQWLCYGHIAGKQPAYGLAKQVVEIAPGELGLRFVENLDPVCESRLIDGPLPTGGTRCHDLGIWQPEDRALQGRADAVGSSWSLHPDCPDGHLQLTLCLQQGAAAGVLIRCERHRDSSMMAWDANCGAQLVLDAERQCLELRQARHLPLYGWGLGWHAARSQSMERWPLQRVNRRIEHGRNYRLRLIWRDEFVEVYLDDFWQITIALPQAPRNGAVECCVERGQARFSALRLDRLRPLAGGQENP